MLSAEPPPGLVAPSLPRPQLFTVPICQGHCLGLQASAEQAVGPGVHACRCVSLVCSLCLFPRTPVSAFWYLVRQRASSQM